MASLLSSASPFTTGKKGKMPARMSKTFQRLTSVDENEPTKLMENFSDPNASNEMTSMEKQIETQKIREEKVQQALSKMTNSFTTAPSGNDDSSSALGDYSSTPHFPPVPVAPPVNTSQSSTTPRDKIEGFASGVLTSSSPFGTANTRTGSSYQQSYGPTEYFQQLTSKNNHKPIYSTASTSRGDSQQQLMEKLNYMIHLLEEQQKEPTQHILEEFLLYGLLGIFMIFLVDSFTRVGKYTR